MRTPPKLSLSLNDVVGVGATGVGKDTIGGVAEWARRSSPSPPLTTDTAGDRFLEAAPVVADDIPPDAVPFVPGDIARDATPAGDCPRPDIAGDPARDAKPLATANDGAAIDGERARGGTPSPDATMDGDPTR